MRRRNQHGDVSGEAGFTLVEVIVAMMIAVFVVSAVAMAVGSSAKLQSASRVQAKMTSLAEASIERARGTRAWMESCGTGTCNLYTSNGTGGASGAGILPANFANDDSFGPGFAFVVSLTARPLDSGADGLVADGTDIDGSAKDLWLVSVTVSVRQADRLRLGNPDPVIISVGITHTGAIPVGKAYVETCIVRNQRDDRMRVGSCSGDTAGKILEMKPCQVITNCAEYDIIKNAPYSNPTKPYNPSKYVINARFDVTPSLSHPTHGSKTGTKIGKGYYVFEGLKSGVWNLNAPATVTGGCPTCRYKRWKTKGTTKSYPQDAPTNNTVLIAPGTTSTGLVLYEPNPANAVTVEVNVKRKTYEIGMGRDHEWITLPWEGSYPDGCVYRENGDHVNYGSTTSTQITQEWKDWDAMDPWMKNLIEEPKKFETVTAENEDWGEWLCQVRLPKNLEIFLKAVVVDIKVVRGAYAPATIETHAEPEGRIIEKTGNQYNNAAASMTFASVAGWDDNFGRANSPMLGSANERKTLTFDMGAGLFSKLNSYGWGDLYQYDPDWGTQPTTPATHTALSRFTWIHPQTGYVYNEAGGGTYNSTLQATLYGDGECFLTIPETTWHSGEKREVYLPGGGWITDPAYTGTQSYFAGYDHKTRACSVGTSLNWVSFEWNGKVGTGTALLLQECDITEYYSAYFPLTGPYPSPPGGGYPDPGGPNSSLPMLDYMVNFCRGFDPPLICNPVCEDSFTYIPKVSQNVSYPTEHRIVNVTG